MGEPNTAIIHFTDGTTETHPPAAVENLGEQGIAVTEGGKRRELRWGRVAFVEVYGTSGDKPSVRWNPPKHA